MKPTTRRLAGLEELAGNYDGILCDVWGVLHNGVAAWPDAVAALSRFRDSGGSVVMITNAPRPNGPVLEQLARLGVGDGVFDFVVTSGDVTRELIGAMSPLVYHIGPERDLRIFESLDIELVSLEEAGAVVCTGLRDDHSETPQDYAPLLQELRQRELPFICANPDIVVEFGDRLLWCAGALARDYRELGGETHIVGKPHRPIYSECLRRLEEAAGRSVETERVLAIGDGVATDIAGANRFGLDAVYISSGIHSGEYGEPHAPDAEQVEQFLAANDARAIGWMPRLRW
jgi:HAD superfamily hydrolase (TIGR01459 family)